MTIQRLIAPAEWKTADDDPDGALEGYLSTFGNVDLQGDVIEKGAFAKTVNRVNKDGIPLLADHNASVRDVLGTITNAAEDSRGLKIRATFASDPDAQSVRRKLLDGHLKAMSIGYEPVEFAYREQDGQRVRVLKEVKLWEGSVVVFPANPQALVGRVKSAVREAVDGIITEAIAAGWADYAVKAALADLVRDQPAEEKAPVLPQSTDPSTDFGDGPVTEAPRNTDGADSIEPAEGSAPAGEETTEVDPESALDRTGDADRLKRLMYGADALLHGDDPDEVADPIKFAGSQARMDALEIWIKQREREAELSDELNRLRR